MKATTFALILLSILTGTCLTSCIDDDFTTNPSHVLAFSTDTVAFDTVFTTIGTSTRSFRIYNRNKKSLNISSIKLADAEHSGFHINVDGMSGDNFTNVEIRGKDSLYVFVEANIDPTNQDNPIFIVDSIVFVTNGVQQDVKLTAYGQDVIIKRGETFTTDTHLCPLTPHIGSFYLEELHALRIAQPLAALLPYGCGIPLAGNQVRCTWLRHESLRVGSFSNRALLS